MKSCWRLAFDLMIKTPHRVYPQNKELVMDTKTLLHYVVDSPDLSPYQGIIRERLHEKDYHLQRELKVYADIKRLKESGEMLTMAQKNRKNQAKDLIIQLVG